MNTVYAVCAVVGGTLIVLQFLLTLVGLGDSGDLDVDAGEVDVGDIGEVAESGGHEHFGHEATNWLFGVLTFRTLSAGVAFFGLAGLTLSSEGRDPRIVLAGSIGVGLLAVFIVAAIMRSLRRLNTDGTIRIQRALGAKGTVYLSIPGQRAGEGKVHVQVLGRVKEYKAVTDGAELPTGSKIVVVGIADHDTVEVRSATDRAEQLHQV